MKFSEVTSAVEGIPFIYERNARMLYSMVLERRMDAILELGIAHGVATCYMAAALDELGAGKIHCVDLESAKDLFAPSPEDLLGRLGLEKYVEIHRMKTGYNWFLHDRIAEATVGGVCQEQYDLCIIDGPKNWTIDGCAFFLVDKLLRKGGTVVFDDYLWTYAGAAKRGNEVTDGVTNRSLSAAELQTPQVREIFELLVRQHPDYGELELYPQDDWAVARKIASRDKTYSVRYNENSRDVLVWFRHKLKDLFASQ